MAGSRSYRGRCPLVSCAIELVFCVGGFGCDITSLSQEADVMSGFVTQRETKERDPRLLRPYEATPHGVRVSPAHSDVCTPPRAKDVEMILSRPRDKSAPLQVSSK